MVKVPNVRVPAELFCNDTALVPPLPATPVPTTVLPKLMLPVDCCTRIPCVVEPDTVVLPKFTVPAT